MDMFAPLIAIVSAVSIAVERIIEIFKGWFPNAGLFATQPDPKEESIRCAWLHVVAGVVGFFVALLSHLDIWKTLGTFQEIGQKPHWYYWAGSWCFIGLLASGGSAFWNHALDIMNATKVKQEQSAIDSVAANAQKNLIEGAHPSSFAMAMRKPLTAARAPVVQPAGVEPAANCLIRPDPNSEAFLASAGRLGLALVATNGSFNFVPLGCSVTCGTKPIAFSEQTPGLLQFQAANAGTYTLVVQYACSQGATAELKENCAGAVVLRHLDDTVNPATIYTINVS